MGVNVGGIGVGVLQWLVLRQQVTRAGWWVPASIVAVAALGVMVFAVGVIDADVGWVVGTVLFGTVLGVLQWLLLRRQLARAGWWVLASGVGWVVGGFLSGAVPVGAAGGFPGWAAVGAVYGAMSGAVLVWLLRQRLDSSAQPSAVPTVQEEEGE
jgi:membrane associated rhomboid family serine protease